MGFSDSTYKAFEDAQRTVHEAQYLHGFLGVQDSSGGFTYDVPSRPGYIYVRLFDGAGITSLGMAVNFGGALNPNILYRFRRQGGYLVVDSPDPAHAIQAYGRFVSMAAQPPITLDESFGIIDIVKTRRLQAGRTTFTAASGGGLYLKLEPIENPFGCYLGNVSYSVSTPVGALTTGQRCWLLPIANLLTGVERVVTSTPNTYITDADVPVSDLYPLFTQVTANETPMDALVIYEGMTDVDQNTRFLQTRWLLNVKTPKHNYAGTATPTTGDDSDDGYEVGSLWFDTTNGVLYWCRDASVGTAVWEIVGGFASFTLTGDSGTPQTISNGNTATVSGGVGLASVASATDTVTLNLDIPSLTADATPDSAADYIVTYDDSASTHKKVLIANLPSGVVDASAVTYTPADNADYGGSDPGNANAAMDYLADHLDAAEADIAALTTGGVPSSGWVSLAQTLTYGSADDPTYTATCAGVDLTSSLSVGMRIRLSQATGGTKYFILTKIAFSTDTTLTLYGGTDYDLNNEAISNPYFSVVKSPYGMPIEPAKWTVEVTDTSNRSQSSPVNGTWYNLGTATISIPIGSWRVNYQVAARMTDASSTAWNMWSTLSTANNSESDVDFTCIVTAGNSVIDFMTTFHREKPLTLTSKTSYYLNSKTTVTNLDTLANRNDLSKLIIRAVCAYL
jgi:hypothetical protein